MQFTISAKSSGKSRCGTLKLPHATVETPVFMPVGTQATVKAMTPGELEELGFGLILGNTYHLHLRPGEDLIANAGGLHLFAGWDSAMLTDSGGFQVFSLSGLRRIGSDGVEFQSHIDGSRHTFTPESVMEIQRKLGADVVMAFDECAPFPCEEIYAREAMFRTHRWATRCLDSYNSADRTASGGWEQSLFAIVQGATFRNLREESAETLASLYFPGYAIGGLAVGEPLECRNECIEWCTAILPEQKPRYLMGVGTPIDILDAVERGVDMFDCVLPTRNARNAQIFTGRGVLNMRNARFTDYFSPPDPDCDCKVCKLHSRAYIRHLFQAKEMLGPRLTTYHNLSYYGRLMSEIRQAIAEDRLSEYRRQFVENYRDEPTE
jgi:queuine tRNA-ribosyltransferase